MVATQPPPASADGSSPVAPSRRAGSFVSSLQLLFRRHEPLWVGLVAIAILVPGLWSFTLIDPWEGHYAEVGRRMLQDNDFVHLKWQNESFRSKPVLTFWLMAASMAIFGVARDGGYSGELVDSGLTMFALRLPFTLFAALGLVMAWLLVARAQSRRAAWMSFGVLITCPLYFLIARQAITDMPAAACMIGALSCFGLAATHWNNHGAGGLPPSSANERRLGSPHILLAVVGLLTISQAIYCAIYFHTHPQLAQGVLTPVPAQAMGWVIAIPVVAGYVGLAGWLLHRVYGTANQGRILMLWAWVFVALAVLAKGPTVALVFAVAGLTLLVTEPIVRDTFSRPHGVKELFTIHLAKLEILRGLLVGALIAVPWHVAMFLKDGRGWQAEYFGHHWFNRLRSDKVHGDSGTFDYFSAPLAEGMWPWIGLVPFAIAALALWRGRNPTNQRLRTLVANWSMCAFALFAFSQTKFHHYILPAVAPLAIAIGIWLDDLWDNRIRSAMGAGLAALAVTALVARDLVAEQKDLVELFVYRYDRPWPKEDMYPGTDLSATLAWMGVYCGLPLLFLGIARLRRGAILALFATAGLWALWTMNSYMHTAATHWGQGPLHTTYYQQRAIHGIEIKYYGLADLARDWQDGRFRARSYLPTDFAVGLSQRVTLILPGLGLPDDRVVLQAKVEEVGDDSFVIALVDGELDRIQEYISRGLNSGPSAKKPWMQIDADRLIAWQLNWRSENFWSAGEIYGETTDTQTVFMNAEGDKKIRKFLKDPKKIGRTYYVITESGRSGGLKGVLPTAEAKASVEILDTRNNKFTLLRFTL